MPKTGVVKNAQIQEQYFETNSKPENAEMHNVENNAFIIEPDKPVGVFSHVPDDLQEVERVLGNILTKGQTLSTHVEPKKGKTNENRPLEARE